MTRSAVAVVTGAASGIGAEVASRLGDAGYLVVGLDIKENPNGLPEGLIFKGGIDVSDTERAATCLREIESEIGSIDILVNAAGIAGSGDMLCEMQAEELRRILEVNLIAPIMLAKTALQIMLPRHAGAIVNVASVAGLEGAPRHLPYSTAKAGLINATRTMAWEYARSGIRINSVSPGLIRTDMTAPLFEDAELAHQMTHWSALGRAGEASEVAAAVAFLASPGASFVSGHCLIVDGGWTTGRDLIPPRT